MKASSTVLAGVILSVIMAVGSLAAAVEMVPGQYVVQLKGARSIQFAANPQLKAMGAKVVRNIRPDMVLIQRTASVDADATVRQLRQLPNVEIAEPNFIFHASTIPNDPDFVKSWGMNNNGLADSAGGLGISGLDLGMEKAWDIETGSKKVVVAIIDTGVNYKHADLAANIWTNQAEANGKTGVDDDGNGYIDDVHGYNFAGSNGDPLDDNGHGSHCAGVIGAEGNNGVGISGVNWNVSIMAVKFLDSSGSGTLEDAVKAIDYARLNHAQIMSNSWGGNATSEILQKAVSDTNDAHALFVVAAGNNSTDNDSGAGPIPASYTFPNVLSVAAVDNRGQLADFSDYGAKTVHIAAPGVNVYSTMLDQTYGTLSGTSMATPHVAGVAALLLAHEPELTDLQLKDRLMASARPLGALRGKVASAGMVNAYYALSGELPQPDANDPTVWTNHAVFPLSTAHPYLNKTDVSMTIKQAGAKRIAAHFARFDTEMGYDKVQFFDGKGNLIGVISGHQTGGFSPIVDGDTMVLHFVADDSNTDYGFDVDYVAFQL